MDELDWNDLKIFIVIAESTSLRKAAQTIGCSQPTLGRHLNGLEATLGLTLVHRHARGISLTPDGQMLMQHASYVRDSVQQLRVQSAQRQREIKGRVVINATDALGLQVLPTVLAPLHEKYPQIDVHLKLDHWSSDVLQGDVDIAIRMYQPTQASLIGRLAAKAPLAVYGGVTGATATCPEVEHVSALRSWPWLSFCDETIHKTIFKRIGLPLEHLHVPYRCDAISGLMQACKMGIGLGIFQTHIARHEPDLRLICQLPQQTLPLWLVTNEQARQSPHIRVMLDGLFEGLASYYSDTNEETLS